MSGQAAGSNDTRQRAALEEYEQSGEGRPPFILTYAEVKLLGIAGVGFFLDAYDLFIINPVSTMLQYRLYPGGTMPANLQGLLKASANIGSVIGQFLFGYCADAFGRKAIYGKELMLIIIATILCISTPTGSLSPNGCLIYLTIFRILLGVGVGGDYPMSASVTSDRATIRKRGTMLAYIFANQGWGSFVGSLVTIVVLACYKHVMNDEDETSKVDGVWRIVIGLSLIPAFGTLYQRLTLPESTRYKKSQEADVVEQDDLEKEKMGVKADVHATESDLNVDRGASVPKKSHVLEVIKYFSEWRHLKILIGTCSCWFLLDVAFYGINLNTNVVLSEIGYAGNTGTPWEKLFKVATGNIIITALGFVPGYYVTVLTIEKLGRKTIQVMGFLMEALFLGILAGKFHSLSTAAFIINFTLLQFFFNFGANATTYCYPAEVFPTRYRAFAHGMSAACGKTGAIISALVFNSLTDKIGTPAVLWIFFGCSILGAACTFLLPEVAGRDPDAVLEEELREQQ
ncbi:major facilitator superfamily domain-containing protein [Suillus fuscotomentosus]|uniref:Major facilitator superfamily domain-containing protein n=1 Tax=Suillus fuscotomentosus TaxID=1912939 RepID=A0AAD4DXH1_9AGAM|nr:major facilitator superfamily domain-containing protein [Suillus fuscotomentosus]KAG1895685.1 major facilitator superfamily domain-containing protein [Suillus fuscotomentosus]